jgi:hypothetical protein
MHHLLQLYHGQRQFCNDNLLFDNGTAPKATPRAGVLMTRDEEDGHY